MFEERNVETMGEQRGKFESFKSVDERIVHRPVDSCLVLASEISEQEDTSHQNDGSSKEEDESDEDDTPGDPMTKLSKTTSCDRTSRGCVCGRHERYMENHFEEVHNTIRQLHFD